MKNEETIISLASPMGTGAISIIRCSGNKVGKIIDTFFKKSLSSNRANYLNFKKKEKVIDDVIAIYYQAPKSYTGEDMLEIMCHGGSVVYQIIIREILTVEGCRLAKPGEFSERSFLNNKMSLLEAESICALINAKTEAAAFAARDALSGKFSKEIIKIDNIILMTRVQVEALLDFSEEDIETEGLLEIEKHIEESKNKIIKLIKKLENNRLLFETSKVAVLGMPNAGKSSLINFLTDEDVSIVNEQAGTTRDVISKIFNLDGMPITIFDTAGIRETNDLVEKEGSEKAIEQAKKVNLTIYMYDIKKRMQKEDLEILKSLKKNNKNILVVANKIDLLEQINHNHETASFDTKAFVSIKTKTNLDDLKNKIIEHLKLAIGEGTPNLYHAEYLKHLNVAFQEINNINLNLSELELVAEKLKKIQEEISHILDNKDEERVLTGIFSNFCIGK